MLGMLGGGENLCGWLFIMELLSLGYHCMRTWQSLYQSEAGRCSWNTDCWTTCNTNGMLIFFCSQRAWNATIRYLLPSNYHCRWKILLILWNLNKKRGINTKKNTVLRGKTRHPRRNLAQKICLIRNWANLYSVAKSASISQISDWLYELTFHPLNDCASSSLINGERR